MQIFLRMGWVGGLTLGFLMASGAAFGSAEEFHTQSKGIWTLQAPQEESWPWKIYAGVASGYGSVSGPEFSKAPGGETVGIGVSMAYEASRWIAEAGLGWFYTKNAGSFTDGRGIELKTRMGMLDLGARAKIGRFWQVGPTLKLAYGTDTSFAPAVSSSSANAFAGARIAYENRLKYFPYRVYAEGVTDISIRERTAYFALIGLQIGLPVGVTKTEIEEVVATSESAPSAPPEVRVMLDPQKIFFAKMSATIRPEVESVLAEIGTYLSSNDTQWEEVEIAGHADRRGRFEYNLELSRKRADAVRQALAAGGANSQKFRTEAYSYLKPAVKGSGPKVWAQNRRVEIVVKNVKDPDTFLQRIRRLEGAEGSSITADGGVE